MSVLLNMNTKPGEVTTPGVRKYYTYEHPELLTKPYELSQAYEKILNIWNKIADYPIIQLLLKFNENFKLFLLPYLYRFEVNAITEERIKPIVECFLRLFAIMEMGEVGYSASIFKTFLFNENFNLVNPNYPDESIIDDFDRHILNNFKEDDLIVDLKDYDKNILVFLNEYLYAQNNGKQFRFENNVNVEHIMPASGHNVDAIRIDAGIGAKEEFDNLVNKLGNKILLEENINKSISNDWFKTKKRTSVKNKQGYLDSEFGLAQALAKYPKDKWKKSDIKQFTEVAAHRIADFVFHK